MLHLSRKCSSRSRIFWGEASGGTCSGCHGSDGKGTTVGPNLTSGEWSWGDGSWQAIAATIEKGVMSPKHADGAMPPRGGAPLSDADVMAVAAFVWGVSHSHQHRPAAGAASIRTGPDS
jgi:mono/diheme cytochrome c family protein